MSLVTPIESNGTDTVTAASPYPKEIAKRLAADFAETAVERDRQGGTAQRERHAPRFGRASHN